MATFDRQAAKKAGYTDQQINDYLSKQSLPERQQQIGGQNTVVAQKGLTGNGLLDTILGFIAPRTANIAQDVMEAGRVQSQVLPQQNQQFASLQQANQLAKQAIAETDPVKRKALLDQSRTISGQAKDFQTNFSPDISKGYLDRGIGAGAEMGVLASGGITGLSPAKGGAVLGGILGLTQPGSNLGQRAAGGAGGAVTGAVVGKVLEKIFGMPKAASETGTALRQGVLKPKVLASPDFASKQSELTVAADRLGLSGSATNQSKKMADLYTQGVKSLGDIVGSSKAKFSPSVIVSDVYKRLEGEVVFDKGGVADAAFNKWLGKLNDFGVKPTAKQINSLKFTLQGELKPVYTKLLKGNPLTEQETVKLAFRNALDFALGEKVPATKPILETLSTLHQLAPGLKQATGASVRLPLIGNIPGATGPVQALQDLLGRGLQGVGKIPSVSAQAATGPTLTSLLGLGGFQGGQTVEPGQRLNIAPDSSGATQQLPEQKITTEQMQQVLMSPDISKKTKDSLLAAYKIQPGSQLTTAEKDKVNQAKSALNLVDVLSKNFAELQGMGLTAGSGGLGRLQGLLGVGASLTQSGSGGAAAAAYKDTKDAFLSKLSRASGEKGVLTDQDVKRIAKALPVFTDSPETAQRKMNTVRQIIGDAVSSKLSTSTDLTTLGQ